MNIDVSGSIVRETADKQVVAIHPVRDLAQVVDHLVSSIIGPERHQSVPDDLGNVVDAIVALAFSTVDEDWARRPVDPGRLRQVIRPEERPFPPRRLGQAMPARKSHLVIREMPDLIAEVVPRRRPESLCDACGYGDASEAGHLHSPVIRRTDDLS